MSAAWAITSKVLQDVDLLAKHLTKMGWEVERREEEPGQGGAEDGSGAALARACSALRLHFSWITVAVQHQAKKAAAQPAAPSLPPPTPPPLPAADWAALAKELRATVSGASCAGRPVRRCRVGPSWVRCPRAGTRPCC